MNLWKKSAFSLTLLIAFLIFANSRVQAQTVLSFNGLEITQGHEEEDEAYGWVCYGRTTGALPGNFTMTLNYTPMSLKPLGHNTLTGGTWTLPVYTQTISGPAYMGVMYGSVKEGKIDWDELGYTGTMEANLSIEGGTQMLFGSQGWVKANITINRSPAAIALGPPPMKGTLTIYW